VHRAVQPRRSRRRRAAPRGRSVPSPKALPLRDTRRTEPRRALVGTHERSGYVHPRLTLAMACAERLKSERVGACEVTHEAPVEVRVLEAGWSARSLRRAAARSRTRWGRSRGSPAARSRRWRPPPEEALLQLLGVRVVERREPERKALLGRPAHRLGHHHEQIDLVVATRHGSRARAPTSRSGPSRAGGRDLARERHHGEVPTLRPVLDDRGQHGEQDVHGV